MGRCRAARLLGVPARVVDAILRSSCSRWPERSSSRIDRRGWQGVGTRCDCISARSRTGCSTSCSAAWYRTCPCRCGSGSSSKPKGVPLYAVEMIRSLIDRDIVVARDGEYTVVGDVGELDVPGTLTSLIFARLDALPPRNDGSSRTCRFSETAFRPQPSAAISGMAVEQIDALLASLVGKEILDDGDRSVLARSGTLRFRPEPPPLGGLQRAQQARKAHPSPRHCAALAEHASPPRGTSSPKRSPPTTSTPTTRRSTDEQRQLRAETVQALTLAGRRASRLGAPDAAETALRRAVAMSSDEEETAAADRGGGHGQTGRPAHRRAGALRTGRTTAHHRRPTRRGQLALAARIGLLPRQGRSPRSGRRCDADCAADPELDREPAQTLPTSTRRSRAPCSVRGHGDDVLHHADRALNLATELGLPDIASRALRIKSYRMSDLGRFDEALSGMSAAVDVAHGRNLTNEELLSWIGIRSASRALDLPGVLGELRRPSISPKDG